MHKSGLTSRLARHLRIAARFLIPRRPAETSRSLRRAELDRRRSERMLLERRVLPAWLFALGFGTTVAADLSAATIYVDSRVGNDAYDGLSATEVNEYAGPVRSIQRAAQLVETGDQIQLINNGDPYVGSFCLHGVGKGGTVVSPLVIHGNGSVITGAKPIEPTAWVRVRDDIWRITPVRKGWYQLVQEDAAVPEIAVTSDATELPALDFDSWCAFQGVVYYRPPEGGEPAQLELSLADEQTGITLIDVEYVLLRDLTIRHFRQDGVHLHDRCRQVVLENVTTTENGRAGIVVGGTCEALLVNVTSTGNRVDSLLVEDLATVDAEGSSLTPAPTVTAQ
jgi:hypothetical protein